MGYNYFILIQALDGDKWINVKCDSCSGSYGCTDRHYFFTHRVGRQIFGENIPGYNEDYYYLFSYKTLEEDFKEYIRNDDISEIKDYISTLIGDNVTRENLEQLRYKIDELLEKDECIFFHELEKYYNQCTEYLQHYDNVRIIYGYTP